MDSTRFLLQVTELCERVALPEAELRELVACGILTPHEGQAGHWEFDGEMVLRARRAARLHRELQIDWPGVALALDLLAEIEALQRENAQLRQRLRRFER